MGFLMTKLICSIPKVDRVLALPDVAALLETCPRPIVLAAVRHVLAKLRNDLLNGTLSEMFDETRLCSLIDVEVHGNFPL